MVNNSTLIPQEIGKLNNEIYNFEKGLNSKIVEKCGPDCYCRKAGNHKITKSQFHKKCITMKKSSASVRKKELIPAQNTCCERKNVFDFGKAQVEVSLKGKPPNVNVCGAAKCDNFQVKSKKLVDTGSDPIAIVNPKKSKKSWSTVLSETNIKKDRMKTEVLSEIPVKLPAPCSYNSSPVHRAVTVRDRGIQCDNGPASASSNLLPSYNPVSSLKTLVKDLRRLKRRLTDGNDGSCLDSIIADMDFAVDRLAVSPPLAKTSTDGRNENHIPLFSRDVLKGMGRSEGGSGGSLEGLQSTCLKLQASCLKLEQTCGKLQTEKDTIMEKFFEKSRELESCLKRELDYQLKLNEAKQSMESMSCKLERYTKSLEELSVHVTKLQAENTTLQRGNVASKDLMSQLVEMTKENDALRKEVGLLSLEKEKNTVLLELKEQELTKLKSELRLSGGLVSEKMLATLLASDSHLALSSAFELSESRELIVSSPEGSAIKSPSKSWQAVSSILSPGQLRRMELPTRTGQTSLKAVSTLKKDPVEAGGSGELRNPLESIHHLKRELRELFAEMKHQTEFSGGGGSASSPTPPTPSNRNRKLPSGDGQDTSSSLSSSPPCDISRWSSVTDSSNGYNSITENELSNES